MDVQKCRTCGSTDIDDGHSTSNICCRKCGTLNEELFITSSLNFTENNGASQLNGQFVRITDTYAKVGGNIIRTTNLQIQNQIKNICGSLGLSDEVAQSAYRWYKLSLQGNLTRGRNILYTLSACIYIVCRQEKTPHLLIDFAQLLDLDVFKIGNIFMRIVVFLNVKVPLIDPSLFLHRFFSKLKLKNGKILLFAMRLISRMKRDWIVVGRRPNNLCGAALVTASRVYAEERSVLEVAKAVKVSPHTINIRLKEMCDTQSANLTVNDFFNVWLEKEEDPPISKYKLKMVDDKTIESGMLTPPSDISERDALVFDEQFLATYDHNDTEDSIDSEELECFILTKEEAKQKEKVWDAMYDSFLRERAVRGSTRRKEHKKRKPRVVYETVEDALKGVIKEKKMTNKINYEALKGLFD